MLSAERRNSVKVTHQANLADSLRRRMEAARAQNNLELISLLEKERQELGLNL
ncbi:MAG: hypothetical protein RMK91_08445 [Pseudanabaenaceae cyanobacterium SKYGB_i_bin29]|nr:hypothetical protein [Pseudanabaenaceae cyanobacterium SKYG29]MDW8421884.1 hypothetical protein [Pseudanabaenaceae cyanobacterium SKYGB_i_bin29]